MKREQKVIILQRILIVVMLVFFAIIFIWEQIIFEKQNDTIDSYMELVDTQREDTDNIVNQWKDSYKDLEKQYADKIRECYELQQNGVEIPKYSYTYDEVILLAKVVQCEAGEYSVAPDSQKWICQVILNRVAASDFPNTITDVVYQKNQFSVMTDGSFDRCVLEGDTLRNVYEVLLFGTDLPSYVKYFYSAHLDHGWIVTLPVYDKLQGTVFAYDEK